MEMWRDGLIVRVEKLKIFWSDIKKDVGGHHAVLYLMFMLLFYTLNINSVEIFRQL